MKKVIILITFLALSADWLNAEDGAPLRPVLGVYANYGINLHKADFREFKNVPTCCPVFETGHGSGFSLGALMEFDLPLNLRIGLRAGISTLNGELSKDESIPVRIGNSVVNGKFAHILNSEFMLINFDPYFIYSPVENFGIHFGGRIGNITTATFDYKEKITNPSDQGVFVDNGKRTRNEQSGDIPEYNAAYGSIFMWLSYELPLNRSGSLKLVPEVFYFQGLSNMADQKDWTISSLSGGLAVKYRYIPDKEPSKREKLYRKHIDTIKIDSYDIAKSHVVKGNERKEYRDEFVRDTIFEMEITYRTDTLYSRPAPEASLLPETKLIDISARFVSESFPSLPVMFFDESSAELAENYIKIENGKDFDIDAIEPNPYAFHDNALNILGQRLTMYPRAAVTLQGAADSTTEKSDCGLARKRAESVVNYLVNVWNIDPIRLKIAPARGNCSPKNPTLTPNDSGWSENRRVDFTSADPRMFMPVVRKRFLEATGISTENVVFNTSGGTRTGIQLAKMKCRVNDNTVWEKEYSTPPTRVTIPLDETMKSSLAAGSSLKADLYMVDGDGQATEAHAEVAINSDTSEVSISRMSLVLFDVGSDRISRAGIESIRIFLNDMRPGATISVKGYTDALGIPERNKALSESRARSAANAIIKIRPDAKVTTVEGVASSEFPPGIDSYATPIDRFLSRAVTIEIRNVRK